MKILAGLLPAGHLHAQSCVLAHIKDLHHRMPLESCGFHIWSEFSNSSPLKTNFKIPIIPFSQYTLTLKRGWNKSTFKNYFDYSYLKLTSS